MKPAVRIGIALGAVALALGIGVATILAVDYRAELHCSPLSGNGVTDHTNCTISGDHRWASHYGPISGDACSFSAYFDTNTWVLTRSATVFPDGTLNQYSVSGGTVVYWDNFGDCPSAPPISTVQALRCRRITRRFLALWDPGSGVASRTSSCG